MALVRFNHSNWTPERRSYRDFSDLMNLFWNDFDGCAGGSCPAANIVETDDSFKIEMAVPGFDKKDFQIHVENQYLTISNNQEEKNEERDERYARKEFIRHSFTRSFRLSEWVDTQKIQAHYENGILTVEIPKREEAKTKPARQIEIS